MVNSRGWLRTVEATMAILLVFGFLIFTSTNELKPAKTSPELIVQPLLDQAAKNSTIRMDAANAAKNTEVVNRIKAIIGSKLTTEGFKYEVYLTDANANPALSSAGITDTKNKEIYSFERIIGPNYLSFNLAKVKIFVWRA